MTKNTPTPWYADHDLRDGMEWNIHIVEHNNPNNRVCFMTSDGPSEANAAFIVKAVNAHEGLVRALEEIEAIGRKSYADGSNAMRMGNIAHAALLAMHHPVGREGMTNGS